MLWSAKADGAGTKENFTVEKKVKKWIILGPLGERLWCLSYTKGKVKHKLPLVGGGIGVPPLYRYGLAV